MSAANTTWVLAALKYLPHPWIWILTTLVAEMTLAMVLSTGRRRALWFNLTLFPSALLVLEVFTSDLVPFFRASSACVVKTDSAVLVGTDLMRPDVLRGYAANAGTIERAVVRGEGGRTIYDVIYTIDARGFRAVPSIENSRVTVATFGCSFAFGAGVNDDETVAAYLQELSRGQYASVNFGLSGYGPHQMLRMIETGFVGAALTSAQPTHAIYEAIPDHVERVNGHYPYITWDTRGPRYRLNQDGEARFTGPFVTTDVEGVLLSIIFKSHLAHAMARLAARRTDDDVELYVAVVKRAADEWRKRFQTEMIVVMWNGQGSNQLTDRLRREGLRVLESAQVFGAEADAIQSWRLDSCDSHPSANANQTLAKYLLSSVLGSPTVRR